MIVAGNGGNRASITHADPSHGIDVLCERGGTAALPHSEERLRAGLSRQAGESDRALSAGRRRRHREPHPVHAIERGIRPAIRDRQSGRRWGGTIGAAIAAKAERDGYTILYDATAFSANPSLYPRLPYDTNKDFQPVFLASLVANLLVVNPSVAAHTVNDVIEIAKAAPGGLDWASSGNGTVQHLCLEMFRLRTGVKLNHIPYRGGGPALNDVIAGQVKFFFSNGAASIGHVESGALRAIAHTGRGRLRTLPGVPAVADTLPGFEAYEWNGVFVPAGTPAAVMHKLNAGLNATLRHPDVIERFEALNVEFRENTPEEFGAFVRAEMEKWGRVVREANIKLG
jgi:tripartite-type tricarboxylate transporter receptor subunit TctC